MCALGTRVQTTCTRHHRHKTNHSRRGVTHAIITQCIWCKNISKASRTLMERGMLDVGRQATADDDRKSKVEAATTCHVVGYFRHLFPGEPFRTLPKTKSEFTAHTISVHQTVRSGLSPRGYALVTAPICVQSPPNEAAHWVDIG